MSRKRGSAFHGSIVSSEASKCSFQCGLGDHWPAAGVPGTFGPSQKRRIRVACRHSTATLRVALISSDGDHGILHEP